MPAPSADRVRFYISLMEFWSAAIRGAASPALRAEAVENHAKAKAAYIALF
jgi:hypothetical protein